MRRGFCVFALAGLILLSGCTWGGPNFEPGDVVWGQVVQPQENAIDLDLGSMSDGAFEPSGETASLPASEAVVVSDAGETLSLGDLVSDDVVRVTMGQNGAQEIVVSRTPEAIAAEQGEAQTIATEEDVQVDKSFTSKQNDESALRVEASNLTFVDCLVNKSGDTTDSSKSRLFGLNAAVLMRPGANVTFDGGNVTTNGLGATGMYSYGATMTLNKTHVTTTKDDSSGLAVTANGTLSAFGAAVTTSGVGSPALRITAGGGATIAGGEYVTNGYDSAVIESSGEISAEEVKVTATHSETIALMGPAHANFVNCSLAGDMDENRGSRAPLNVHGILICQEGSKREGLSEFSVEGGSITNNAGDLFFVTNTDAHLRLQGVTLQNASADAALVRVSGNNGQAGLGEAGSNAASATLTCVGQTLNGNLVADADSSLRVELTEHSDLTGEIVSEATSPSDLGTVDVVIETGSTWRLTGDCSITTLENHGTIVFDGHKLTLADGSVLGG